MNDITTNKRLDDQKIERGRRLKLLRTMANLTQEALCEKYSDDFSLSTLKFWEIGRGAGLSEKGAEKIINAFANEGIHSTIEWLLWGIGSQPYIASVTSSASQITPILENEAINQELKTFFSLHSNAVTTTVADDGMEPFLTRFDTVAGTKLYQDDIAKLIGKYCIVETNDGQMLCRQVLAGTKEKCYTLACINPKTTVPEPIIYNSKLTSAAAIIWIRKPSVI